MTHEESIIQAEIVSALSLLGVFVFMVPNDAAGKISPQKASRLKAMGLRSGVSDLVAMRRDGVACFLEVKTEKGKLSESQERFQKLCQGNAWYYYVVRSVDDALTACHDCGILSGARGAQ